jgi:hypothetical protein
VFYCNKTFKEFYYLFYMQTVFYTVNSLDGLLVPVPIINKVNFPYENTEDDYTSEAWDEKYLRTCIDYLKNNNSDDIAREDLIKIISDVLDRVIKKS